MSDEVGQTLTAGWNEVLKMANHQEELKPIVNRLARAIGHLEYVKRMVEEGRDCSEILIQLSAVESAINSTGVELLKDHIDHVVVEAVKEGNTDAIEGLKAAIERYVK